MTTSLNDFPSEILLEVAQSLEDLPSVHAFAQASPFFYEIFKKTQESIIRCMVSNTIHPDLLIIATAAVESAYPEYQRLEVFRDWFGPCGVRNDFSNGR